MDLPFEAHATLAVNNRQISHAIITMAVLQSIHLPPTQDMPMSSSSAPMPFSLNVPLQDVDVVDAEVLDFSPPNRQLEQEMAHQEPACDTNQTDFSV